jgi:hypothetical protein
MNRYTDRLLYMYFMCMALKAKADVVKNHTDFYTTCSQSIFCNLDQGDVDFPAVLKRHWTQILKVYVRLNKTVPAYVRHVDPRHTPVVNI